MTNSWKPIDEILAVLNDPEWQWYWNTDCKYVDLRIDTRDMHALIRDRHGKTIDLEKLKYQYKKEK